MPKVTYEWPPAYAKRRYVLAFFQKLPPCLVGIEACASSCCTCSGLLMALDGRAGVSAFTETLGG